MLADLEELTTIRLHNGFRMAATAGEAEALDYVSTKLGSLSALKAMGMELERQSFNTYVTTEIHGNQLFLTPTRAALRSRCPPTACADRVTGSRTHCTSIPTATLTTARLTGCMSMVRWCLCATATSSMHCRAGRIRSGSSSWMSTCSIRSTRTMPQPTANRHSN